MWAPFVLDFSPMAQEARQEAQACRVSRYCERLKLTEQALANEIQRADVAEDALKQAEVVEDRLRRLLAIALQKLQDAPEKRQDDLRAAFPSSARAGALQGV